MQMSDELQSNFADFPTLQTFPIYFCMLELLNISLHEFHYSIFFTLIFMLKNTFQFSLENKLSVRRSEFSNEVELSTFKEKTKKKQERLLKNDRIFKSYEIFISKK